MAHPLPPLLGWSEIDNLFLFYLFQNQTIQEQGRQTGKEAQRGSAAESFTSQCVQNVHVHILRVVYMYIYSCIVCIMYCYNFL